MYAPELHEEIEGNHARCLYSVVLYIIGWSLASQFNSIRGFQDIKMRQPELFNANIDFKMMEFR